MANNENSIVKGLSGNVYTRQEAIGSGAFGKVHYVQNQKTSERLVCKTEDTIERYSTLLYESWVIQRFTHSLLGSDMHCLQIRDVEYEQERFSIIMESGGTSLNKYIERHGNFADTHYSVKNLQFLLIARHTLLLLKHFHSAGLIHRDVKPHNITMKPETMEVFLIDFGLCVRYKAERHSEIARMNFAGTIYFAPRASHKKLTQTPRDDIESLCYSLVYISGTLPWRGIPVGDDKHDRFRQLKEDFIAKIDDQKNIHPVIKTLIAEIKNFEERSIPFPYDRIAALIDEQIKDVRTKVTAGF